MATDILLQPQQSQPVANFQADLYTVPALTYVVVSTLNCCNNLNGTSTIRITVAPNGAADASSQNQFWCELSARESKSFTLGMTLTPTDVVRVWSDTGQVAFTLYGSKRT